MIDSRFGYRTENDTSFSPSPSKREICWKFEYFNYSDVLQLQPDHRINYIHRQPVNTRNNQLMNLLVLSWQSALLVKMFHQLENICSLLNWLSSRFLYGSEFVDLYRQDDLQGPSFGHHPESVQESFCYQTHQYH